MPPNRPAIAIQPWYSRFNTLMNRSSCADGSKTPGLQNGFRLSPSDSDFGVRSDSRTERVASERPSVTEAPRTIEYLAVASERKLLPLGVQEMGTPLPSGKVLPIEGRILHTTSARNPVR